MCVIIIKPANVAMPDINELEAAYRCNPNGCGFISSEGKSYKGLSFPKFCKAISKVKDSEACIIHFRLATHGSIKPANCHPFNCDGVWFAHNGILGVKPRGDMTDSETAFRDILQPVIEKYGLKSPQASTAINTIIGSSKFAFMIDGKITLYGRYENVNGLYYSNTRHLASPILMRPSRDISWDEYLRLRYM